MKSRGGHFRRSVVVTSVIAIVASAFVAISAVPAAAASFTFGDLVAVRVGDGSAALNANATPVFLDEIRTSDGGLQQSIPMPAVGAGTNRRLTLSGTATSEGALARSADGNYLTLAGYDATPGFAGVSTTTTSSVNRVVGRIDTLGNVDTSTAITDGFSGSNVRGAVTDNGSRFWVAGTSSGVTGGVRLAPFGVSGTTTQIASSPDNARIPAISGGQLYMSSGSGVFQGVNTVGIGLPTTSPQTVTRLNGVADTGPNQFALVDRDMTVPGDDTLYVADNAAGGGILKFSFDGLSWTARGSIPGSFFGLAAQLSGTNVVLYATSGTVAGNTIVTLTDTGAFNANITGSPSTVVTAPANTVFRGLAFAPAPCVDTISGLWGGTFTSTQNVGQTGTWNSDITFSAAAAPSTLSGALHSDGPLGPFDGPATGSVTCVGAFSVQATNGTVSFSFSTGQLDSATQTASGTYKVTNGPTQIDAGNWSGAILPPTITKITPSAAPEGLPTPFPVEIDGTNFNGLITASVAGATTPITFASQTKIILGSPFGGGNGTWHSYVQTKYGSSPNTPADVFTFNPPSAYGDAVLADSPLAYWRMRAFGLTGYEGDASGNDRNATYTPCVDHFIPGALIGDTDNASSFTGDACRMSYVPAGGVDKYAGPFSVEAWIKPTGPVTRQYQTFISSRWPNTEATFDLKLTGTSDPGGKQLYADLGNGAQFLSVGGVPFDYQPGQWYHVAVTLKDGDLKFYVNGQLLGTKTGIDMSGTGPVLFGPEGIAVGDNPRYEGNPDGEFFDGDIDEVALYSTPLTQAQIENHYLVGTNQLTATAALTVDSATVPAVQSVSDTALPAAAIETGASADSAGNAASAALSSIPLASSALGSIPLRSIPLRSIGSSLLARTLLSDLPVTYPNGCSGTTCTGWPGLLAGSKLAINPLQSTTLADVLADPTAAAALNSLPLSALDVSSSPLRSIPLAAIALAGVPLRSIALPGSGTTDASRIAAWCTKLSSIGSSCGTFGIDPAQPASASNVDLLTLSLGGVSVDSIPLRSISFRPADLTSSPLRSIDLTSSPLRSIPLRSIDLASTPLRSIPLRSIPLRSIPLGALPLRSIPVPSTVVDCTKVDCSTNSNATLGDAETAGAVLATANLGQLDGLDSTPLRSIPLRSIAMATSPLRSIPLRSIDLAGSPLRSIPLRSIPLRSIPLGAIPLRSIPVPSTVVDCTKVDCSANSSATLGDAEAAGAVLDVDLGHLDGLLSAPLRSIPLRSINMATSPLRSIPLRSIDLESTPLRSIPLRSIPLRSIPLGAIPLRSILVPSAVVDCTLVDCSSNSTATLGDAVTANAVLATATLSQLDGLDSAPLRSIPLRSIDMTTSPLRSIPLRSIDAITAVVDCTKVDCSATSTATLGDASAANAIRIDATLAQLGRFFGTALGDLATTDYGLATLADLGAFFGTVLGDLIASQYGSATLADLGEFLNTTLLQLFEGIDPSIPGFPDFSLTDLLRGLIPVTSYPWQSVDLNKLDVGSLGTGGGSATFTATVNNTLAAPQHTDVTFTLPASLSYSPGSASVDGTAVDPAIAGNVLHWGLSLDPGPHSVTFRTVAGSGIGPAVTTLTVAPDAGPAATASATVDVVDSFEPDDTPDIAPTMPAGELTMAYINGSTDTDWRRVTVSQGDELALTLQNLPADYDIALFAPAAPALQSATPQPVPSVTDVAPGTGSQPPAGANEVDLTAPSGYQLFAVSAGRGTGDETIQTPPLDAGTYLVHITGFNDAWSNQPYVLRARLIPTVAPTCSIDYPNAFPAATALPTSYPANVNTLFLVNTQRMTAAYGATATQQVMSALNGVANDSADGVIGAVVPVDGDPAVGSAYATWSSNPCRVAAANGVVTAVGSLVDKIRTAHPTVTNVVVVGADDQIPFARLADGTVQSNERDYAAGTFPGESNVLAGALSAGYYFSDDPLASMQPLAVGSATLYVPEVALGRLVETPAQIVSGLQRFVSTHGVLNASPALSTGYSFLSGGAQLVETNLAKVTGRTVSQLINETWTRQDLKQALTTNPAPKLTSLNAHFDFSRALPAAGNTTGDQSDLFTTADVRATPSAYTGGVLFSMGCHSGLSANAVELAASGVNGVDDWTKAFADTGALWVGNTGYGYADSDVVAYSARLMSSFAANLDGSSSVGAALADAKHTYNGGNALLSPYDVKALMESTFYGLPMYRLNSTPPAPPAPPTPPTTFTDTSTGLAAASISIGNPSPLTFNDVTASNGHYFAASGPNPQVQTTEFRPIEPLTSIEVTQPAAGGGLSMVAHGALITTLTSTDQALASPAVSSPGVDHANNTIVPGVSDPFPANLARVATYQSTEASGAKQHQQLNLILGQYLPGASPSSGAQRLFRSLSAEVLYAPASNHYFTPPTVDATRATVTGSQIQFSVTTSAPGAAVKRVLVLYTDILNPGSWTPVELSSFDGTHFTGSAGAPMSGRFSYIVQAVDAVGNVGIAMNKGEGFVGSPTAPSAPAIMSTPSAGFTVGTPGTFDVSATGFPVPTLSAVGTLPSGITFDAAKGEFSGTPADGSEGVYTVQLTATSSDPVPAATQAFTLFVAKRPSAVKPGVFTQPVSATMSGTGSVVDVPVALSAASLSTVSVSYDTLDKTAKAGLDYQAASGIVTFAPGQTLAHVHVNVAADVQDGPNLLFQVKLKRPVNASLGLSTSSVTLVNLAGPMVAYVNNPVLQPASAGQTVDFVVSLSSPVAAGHTVSVPYVTANGSAQAGLDYAGVSGTVVFTAGQSTQTIPVTILNTVASARTLFLKFGKPIGTTLATKKATATIAPAGPVVPPWITAASPSVLMSGAGSVVDVPVSLSSPSTSAVSVPYTTMNKTAIADTDYVAQTGTLTFAPGQTLAHISIPIFPDTQAGPNLVFQVKFKKPVGATLGTLASIVTLVDPVGPMLVYVDNPIVRPASEGQTTQFVVTLSSPITSGRPVLVPYSTMNGSALAGVDYTAVSGTLSYADGQSSLVVPIDILDASVLSARTFSLKFGKATGAALATSKGTATIAPG